MNNSIDDLDKESGPLPYSFWLGALVLRGSVTSRIIIDVLLFGVVAFAAVLVSRFSAEYFSINLAVPVGPFEAAGAVLGLLLVLRFNAGYDRWWEARKLWGGIVNQSRNLAISALSYGPEDDLWRVKFVRWAAAFPHVIRRSLRKENDLPELERLIGAESLKRLEAAEHMPSLVSKELGVMLRSARTAGMDGFAFHETDRQRGLMIDYLGGCERILNTPLSRASVINVRRFILLFLSTLPFALLNDLKVDPSSELFTANETTRMWLVPLFVMLMAYPLLALDRLGMELQNPFEVRRLDFLPLDKICLTIESNLLELLNDDPVAAIAAPSADIVEAPPDAVFRKDAGPMDTNIS